MLGRVILYLCGGLGNQLFQYAAARALAMRFNVPLRVDIREGFRRDHMYRRSYALDKAGLHVTETSLFDRWLMKQFAPWDWMGAAHPASVYYRRFGSLRIENSNRFLPEIAHSPVSAPTLLAGYWQSESYFSDLSTLLRAELRLPRPLNPRVLELGKQMRAAPSIAIGLRLYEETADPLLHARNGRETPLIEVANLARQLQLRHPDAQIFCFSTARSAVLQTLLLPQKTTFITPDSGFTDTLDSLWLLSQCRHHVFNNSSFYWWGAWLSETEYAGFDQDILAADSFINEDAIPERWRRF